MLKNKRIIGSVIVIILIAFIVYVKMKNATETQRGLPVPVVVAGTAQRMDVTKSEYLTGDILPVQQATIYARVSGNLQRIFVDIGSNVKENQIIALIDTTIYAQNLKQAKANLAQAEATYKNNKVSYERNKTLFEQNLIAKQDLDNSQTTMEASQAQRDAASANYQNAATQLSYCKVTAPFSGVITKRLLDAGTYISTGGATVNSTIFVIMNTDKLKTLLNVPERDVPLLKNILDIEVKADALPGQTFKAKLAKISESVDLSTRTMTVELQIENTSRTLKPGMFATFKLVLEKKPNSLVLPTQVILNDDNGNYVFLLQPDTTVIKRAITRGITDNNNVEILSGLTESDKVIVSGQTLIKDKLKVKISK